MSAEAGMVCLAENYTAEGVGRVVPNWEGMITGDLWNQLAH
jgi:hypothetical protein